MNMVDVFAVYGDFGNFGDGTLIGVFDNIKEAEKSAKGRGSLDCGGDGHIKERKAIQDGEEFYLLELNFPISINKELSPDPRYKEESYSIVVTRINNSVEFMKILRKRTGISLRETKDFMDTFYAYGKAKIQPCKSSFDGTFSKDEAMSWKQEVELNDVAKLEFG
jgi:ribosomal protein L7/L12